MGTSQHVSTCFTPSVIESITLGGTFGEVDWNSSMLTISRGDNTEGWLFVIETVVLTADSTISSLKGMFLPWEPVEEAGSRIWFDLFLELFREKDVPLQDLNPSLKIHQREASSAWVVAWFLLEICMGEEGPGIDLEAWALSPRDKRLPHFNYLHLPHEVFCSPVWVVIPKRGKPTARRPPPWPLPLQFLLFWRLGSWPQPFPLPFHLPW